MLSRRSVRLRRMSAQRCLCVLASLIAFSSCSVHRAEAPSGAPVSKDFQSTIAQVERDDPASPAVLIAQLNYAAFLLEGDPATCAQRLQQAQGQLDRVNASPKASVMFPGGWARAFDIEYRLHVARADCAADANRENELHAGAAAARRAVELYGDLFDYRSMVIMQFDRGVILRQLGENAAAIEALERALDMDREYGFQDDAQENTQLLLSWRGEPADDAAVARHMRDFPKRRTALQFKWHPSDQPMELESHRLVLEDGQILRRRTDTDFQRRIAPADSGGWNVSYAQRVTQSEPEVMPATQGSQRSPAVFSPANLLADFKVSPTGEFEGVAASTAVSTGTAARADGPNRTAAPPDHDVQSPVEATEVNPSPGMIEAAVAENYQLETAMWIGATLDQGVWHEVSAPLSLPGMPRVVVQNRVQFAFTHRVACTVGDAAPTCVEIVIHATPDPEAVDQLISDFKLPPPYNVRIREYTASTYARIVMDPETLLSYAREERVYWYASIGKGTGDSTLQSEHLVSRAR